MGIDISFDIFIDEPAFVPTKQQLRGIAIILRDVGIIDEAECKALDGRIDAFYPDSPTSVTVQGEAGKRFGEVYDQFSYMITGPKKFPFFDNSNDDGELHEQTMTIYGEGKCMDPYSGGRYTRFVIAHVYHYRFWAQDWLDETEARRKMNPVLKQLQYRLNALLGVPVVIETCYS
jgi:hypothetical protein